MPSTPQCWLIGADGNRVRVGEAGVLLGRDPAVADLLTLDESASRRHAFVHPTPGGPELHHLGQNPTLVNGVEVETTRILTAKDRVELPGLTVMVEVGEAQPAPLPEGWFLRAPGGTPVAVRGQHFSVGGDPSDDLLVPTWPAGAVSFHGTGGTLWVELIEGVTFNGETLPEERVEPVRPGCTLAFGGTALAVYLLPTSSAATAVAGATSRVSSACLQWVANGGRLTVTFGRGKPRTVWLADLRSKLVAVLLQPPGTLRPGDDIDDSVLAPRVWHPFTGQGREEINLLILRTRRALIKAGIPGDVIERAPGGGATRFRLPRGVSISVSVE